MVSGGCVLPAMNGQITKHNMSLPMLTMPHYNFLTTVRRTPRGLHIFCRYLLLSVGLSFALFVLGEFLLAQINKQQIFSKLMHNIGFHINHITIQGNEHFTQKQLTNILGVDSQVFLPSFDVAEARSRLLTFPWVKDAVVEKSYPDMLNIHIIERQPYAVLRHASAFVLIDKAGLFIKAVDLPTAYRLPLIIAEHIDEEAMNIVGEVNKLWNLQHSIAAYIRIADRRWDIKLNNNVVIKLPASGDLSGLSRLLASKTLAHQLDIPSTSIDLRDSALIIVSPASNASASKGVHNVV